MRRCPRREAATIFCSSHHCNCRNEMPVSCATSHEVNESFKAAPQNKPERKCFDNFRNIIEQPRIQSRSIVDELGTGGSQSDTVRDPLKHTKRAVRRQPFGEYFA